MERPQLIAQRRPAGGHRHAQRLRQGGFVPGVVYGKTSEAISVMLPRKELLKMLHARHGEHGLVNLRIDADGGKGSAKSWEKPVLIKQLQRDPVAGDVVHIDFHAITLTEHIRIKIPIVLQGEPVGVKQDGGLLEHFLREVEIDCLPTEIPKQVEFDISQLKIGDAVHVRELTPPAGSKIVSDPEGVIASVLAPKAEKLEEAAEAVTEPEVIREKKPEAEGEAALEGKKPEAKEAKKEEK